MAVYTAVFIRSNKGVTLTSEGAQLYEHVQVAYEHLQRAENEIRDGLSLLHGHLSIGVSESALHGLLLPVLHSFHQLALTETLLKREIILVDDRSRPQSMAVQKLLQMLTGVCF